MRLRLGDVPWRGVAELGLIVALSLAGALLPPGLGLVCVLAAAALGIRVLAKLAGSRGLTDYRQ